jgi:hypothetical protein
MIGLREDQQMKARMIDYLNHAAAHCGSWLACDSGGPDKQLKTDTPPSQASQLPQWAAVSFRQAVGSAASKGAG